MRYVLTRTIGFRPPRVKMFWYFNFVLRTSCTRKDPKKSLHVRALFVFIRLSKHTVQFKATHTKWNLCTNQQKELEPFGLRRLLLANPAWRSPFLRWEYVQICTLKWAPAKEFGTTFLKTPTTKSIPEHMLKSFNKRDLIMETWRVKPIFFNMLPIFDPKT